MVILVLSLVTMIILGLLFVYDILQNILQKVNFLCDGNVDCALKFNATTSDPTNGTATM